VLQVILAKSQGLHAGALFTKCPHLSPTLLRRELSLTVWWQQIAVHCGELLLKI
jgi:hypothetical protein